MQKLILLILIICLFLLHTSNVLVQARTSASDIAALRAFKASVKPSSIPPWSCLASWNFTIDPCSVPRRTSFVCGLTCTPDSTRISQITLDPAGYSGSLTPLLSQLSKLTTLDLAENSFFGPIPSSLSSLSNLQTLTLRSNFFSGSIPPSLTSLKLLESLDLAHNSLSGSLPNSMNSLISLRRIDVSFNKLTGSLPKLPPNLIELALKGNSLSGPLYKSTFDQLNQLEVVELSENVLAGTLQAWFFQLPSLQQADLANNSFTGLEISRPVGGNSNLVAVNLGFNKIQGYLPVNFAAYPLLSSLSLRYNSLRGTIPFKYSQSKSIGRLFLDGNFLIGKPPAGFFAGETSVSGSLGDNCLQNCPVSSQLCTPAQKPSSVCKQAYRGKPRS